MLAKHILIPKTFEAVTKVSGGSGWRTPTLHKDFKKVSTKYDFWFYLWSLSLSLGLEFSGSWCTITFRTFSSWIEMSVVGFGGCS